MRLSHGCSTLGGTFPKSALSEDVSQAPGSGAFSRENVHLLRVFVLRGERNLGKPGSVCGWFFSGQAPCGCCDAGPFTQLPGRQRGSTLELHSSRLWAGALSCPHSRVAPQRGKASPRRTPDATLTPASAPVEVRFGESSSGSLLLEGKGHYPP